MKTLGRIDSLEKFNILVTGGAGFIGSHLVDALIEKGHQVRILDSLVSQVHEDGLPEHLNPSAEFVRGDVCDPTIVEKALEDVNVVFHEAAEVGVGQSMYEVQRYVRANDLGTAVLLENIIKRRHKIKKLIVASSMSIYGEGAYRCAACGRVYPQLREDVQLLDRRWEMECPACKAALSPVGTAMLSLLLNVRPPNRFGLLGISLGLLGAALIVWGKSSGAGQGVSLWLLLALAVPLFLAVGNVYRSIAWPQGVGPKLLGSLTKIGVCIKTDGFKLSPSTSAMAIRNGTEARLVKLPSSFGPTPFGQARLRYTLPTAKNNGTAKPSNSHKETPWPAPLLFPQTMSAAPSKPNKMPNKPNLFGGRTLSSNDNNAVATGESANIIPAMPLPIFGITVKVSRFGIT